MQPVVKVFLATHGAGAERVCFVDQIRQADERAFVAEAEHLADKKVFAVSGHQPHDRKLFRVAGLHGASEFLAYDEAREAEGQPDAPASVAAPARNLSALPFALKSTAVLAAMLALNAGYAYVAFARGSGFDGCFLATLAGLGVSLLVFVGAWKSVLRG